MKIKHEPCQPISPAYLEAMNTFQRPSRRKGGRNDFSMAGFTLTELLISIAIVALLIVLAVPIYQKVIASAQRSKCAANLRQIGVGIGMVIADHPPLLGPGYFPPLDFRDEKWNRGTWYLLVAEQLGLTDPGSDGWRSHLSPRATIFCCPANKAIPVAKQLGRGELAYHNLSYGYHDTAMGSGMNPDWRDENIKPVAQHTDLAKLVMVADSNNDGKFDYQLSNWGGESTWVGDRHGGGANTLFADGHVEWIKKNRFSWSQIPSLERDGIVVDAPPPH